MTSPAPLSSSSGSNITRANWLGRYLDVERDFDERLKMTLTDALSHVDEAFDSVKENFSGKVRRQQYAAAKKSMRDVLSHVFGVTNENIRESRQESAIAAVDAELYEERGILARIFSNSIERQQYADSLRQSARRNVENVVARTLFSERPLSQQVYKTEAYANNLVSQAVNRGLARGDAAKEIAESVKHMINPNTPGGISYAARRLGTTEVNNAFHATAIKSAQDVPWVGQMEWHLSKVHKDDPGDECETYSTQRYFDAEHVPDKPHPFCRCYVTPKQQEYAEFENALLAGQYDQYLDSVLGVEPEGAASARQEIEWPDGATDRVRKEYEKALKLGKTDIYLGKDASPSEKKAAQKLTNRLQNAVLRKEQEAADREFASATALSNKKIQDLNIPDSISVAENPKQVANYLMNRYEGLEVSGFDTADIDTVASKEIATAFVERQAKESRTNIRAIRIVEDLPEEAAAETRYNKDGKQQSDIVFNRSWIRDPSKFAAEAKRSTKTGFLSKAARDPDRPFYSTFVHEWGHVLDYSGGQRLSRGIDPIAEIDQVFAATGKRPKVRAGKALMDRFVKERYSEDTDITPEIITEYEDWVLEGAPSGYSFRDKAKKNLHKDEIIAESFLEFMKNPNAHSMTKSIVQELYKNIKENRTLKVVVKEIV